MRTLGTIAIAYMVVPLLALRRAAQQPPAEPSADEPPAPAPVQPEPPAKPCSSGQRCDWVSALLAEVKILHKRLDTMRETNEKIVASRNRANADAAELERKLAAEQLKNKRLEEALNGLAEAFTRHVPAIQAG